MVQKMQTEMETTMPLVLKPEHRPSRIQKHRPRTVYCTLYTLDFVKFVCGNS